MSAELAGALRRLPSVDRLVRSLEGREVTRSLPRARLTVAARELHERELRRNRAE